MAPYLQVPQTPSAKTAFDIEDLESVSDDATARDSSTQTRPPSEATVVASSSDEDISKRREKSVSPHRSQHLEPPDVFRRVSIGSLSDAHGLLSPIPLRAMASSPDPRTPVPPPPALQTPSSSRPIFSFWQRHRAVFYVFLAQLFGALMNLTARLLELEGAQGMHPVQMLFVRMSMTAVVSSLYMYHAKVPHFPLGPPPVRWLLVIRGFTGFFGIFGMWYSMMYLPLAEATVFTFLAPSVSGYICHVLLHEPFTRKEQIASLLALVGVVFIARPTSLFASSIPEVTVPEAAANATVDAVTDVLSAASAAASAATSAAAAAAAATAADIGAAAINSTVSLSHHPQLGDVVPPEQRLIAIGVALLGVLGSSFAFTSIRAIGTRAHPLISVNYFSTWCTIVSTSVLIAAPILDIGQPDLQFAFPHSLRQWIMLILICFFGFGTQYFVTKGLSLERSNRATAMMYTNMLFAAGFDRFVFGHEMGLISLMGCGLIIGSALWAVLSKGEPPRPAVASDDVEMGQTGQTGQTGPGREENSSGSGALASDSAVEAIPMLAAVDSDEDGEDEWDGRQPPPRLA